MLYSSVCLLEIRSQTSPSQRKIRRSFPFMKTNTIEWYNFLVQTTSIPNFFENKWPLWKWLPENWNNALNSERTTSWQSLNIYTNSNQIHLFEKRFYTGRDKTHCVFENRRNLSFVLFGGKSALPPRTKNWQLGEKIARLYGDFFVSIVCLLMCSWDFSCISLKSS